MSEVIWVALISGGVTLLGNLLVNSRTKNLIMYRLDRLEEKQDKHNNLIERMTIVEQSTKAAHHRLDGLMK